MSIVSRIRSIWAAALLVVLAGAADAVAAPGDLDPSFGTSGVALDPAFTRGANTPVSIAIQSSGRIVAGGWGEGGTSMVRRYLSDGTPDATFGGTGTVVLGGSVRHLCLDASDRIVATGDAFVVTNPRNGSGQIRLLTWRLLANGAVDSSFGTAGVADLGIVGNGRAVMVQPDGKIVVGGERTLTSKVKGQTVTNAAYCLVRYNANGTADTGFGSSGVVTDDVTTADDWIFQGAIGLQSDGTIVVGGSAGFTLGVGTTLPWVVARYSSAGASLGKTTATGDYLRGLAVDSSDRIVATGQRTKSDGMLDVLVARYSASGAIDATFGSGGYLVGNNTSTTRGNGVRIASDGKIVVGIQYGDVVLGGNPSASMARAVDSGAWDSGFGTGGFGAPVYEAGRVYQIYEPALDSSGNPVIGGRAMDDANPPTNKSLFLARHLGS